MFNNIIYFIIVLLIFNLKYPDEPTEGTFLFPFLTLLVVIWFIYAFYCRWEFQRLLRRIHSQGGASDRLVAPYQRSIAKLSVMAILAFFLASYLFHLKYWLQQVPFFQEMAVLQGTGALSVFLLYLTTMWYYAYPVYTIVFDIKIQRQSFILSNLRLNLPILFPWFFLTLTYDLLGLSPWEGTKGILGSVETQMIFFITLLGILMVFLPVLVRFFWGCKPFENSDKVRAVKSFLQKRGFKYRGLLKWPAFEGKMLTAGIMGIVPRYSYLLITDSLVKALSIDELKAVVAHEMGHARYKHLLFYVLFFVGFIVISFGLFDVLLYLSYASPFSETLIASPDPGSLDVFFLALSVPMLLALFVYFRFVMGFFMRNFERQADLYSAWIMGTPKYTISSLEKIGLLSGKTRDLPSWHHFSIKERTGFLERTLRQPGLFKKHNRFLTVSFLAFLLLLSAIGYTLNFSPLKDEILYRASVNVLKHRISENPVDPESYKNLAIIYHEMGNFREAAKTYKKVISLDPDNAVALNNLAWLLVTAPSEELRDREQALNLAKRAVAIEKSPVFLDTLAEAYYASGFINEAVDTIKEAINTAKGKNRNYYREQLEKFLNAKDK